jgi:Rrf2 family protein
MKLSTRSRYGLRFLVALAADKSGEPVYLGDLARGQDIPEKYLSKIVIPLKGAGLIGSTRGTRGGYVLAGEPKDITLREIVEILEGGINTVDCTQNKELCDRAGECVTREIWRGLDKQIYDYLEAITLASVVEKYLERLSETQPPIYYI